MALIAGRRRGRWPENLSLWFSLSRVHLLFLRLSGAGCAGALRSRRAFSFSLSLRVSTSINSVVSAWTKLSLCRATQGKLRKSLPTGRAGVSSAPCARLRRGLASSRLRPAQRKRVRGFSRCPVGASASFACEAVGFGGLGFGAEGGAGGVAGGGFGLNFAGNGGKTPDFHFSPFAPTAAACALRNFAGIRRTSSLLGAPGFAFRGRSVFI